MLPYRGASTIIMDSWNPLLQLLEPYHQSAYLFWSHFIDIMLLQWIRYINIYLSHSMKIGKLLIEKKPLHHYPVKIMCRYYIGIIMRLSLDSLYVHIMSVMNISYWYIIPEQLFTTQIIPIWTNHKNSPPLGNTRTSDLEINDTDTI